MAGTGRNAEQVAPGLVPGEPFIDTAGPPMRNRHEALTSRMRLRDYDYASPGTYFITICTEQRLCHFGDIVNDQVVQSPAGQVIESWWDSIPRQFAGLLLDERIVMPNHLHGLIMLGTDPALDLGRQPSPINEIVRWFKSMSTRDYILGVKREGWPRFPGKLWQSGYHDHIVRSDAALDRIRNYIGTNPSQWSLDAENPRQ